MDIVFDFVLFWFFYCVQQYCIGLVCVLQGLVGQWYVVFVDGCVIDDVFGQFEVELEFVVGQFQYFDCFCYDFWVDIVIGENQDLFVYNIFLFFIY